MLHHDFTGNCYRQCMHTTTMVITSYLMYFCGIFCALAKLDGHRPKYDMGRIICSLSVVLKTVELQSLFVRIP